IGQTAADGPEFPVIPSAGRKTSPAARGPVQNAQTSPRTGAAAVRLGPSSLLSYCAKRHADTNDGRPSQEAKSRGKFPIHEPDLSPARHDCKRRCFRAIQQETPFLTYTSDAPLSLHARCVWLWDKGF